MIAGSVHILLAIEFVMPDLDRQQYLIFLQRKIKAALRARDVKEANVFLDQLKQESPLSCLTRGLDLELTLLGEQTKEALVLAALLVVDFPDSARIFYLSGKAHYQHKTYAAALAAFSESHRLFDHWQTLRWIGKTHTQRGEFSKAESQLLALVSRHRGVHHDLAWLYERMGEMNRALQHAEQALIAWPQNQSVQAQVLRLKSMLMDTKALDTEVATLLALNEEIPDALLITHITNLLASGQGAKARDLVAHKLADLSAEAATKIGWNCYHAHAYDLVLNLFLKALPAHLSDAKYLVSLESAAKKCHRLDEVIEQYQRFAEQNKPLFGRIKRMQKWV